MLKGDLMDYENILVNVNDSVAVITFNRPKALNALNHALLTELSTALDAIAVNADIRVLVLTGSGEKAFVAGADITELAKLSPLQSKLLSERGHAILSKLENMPQPVIAAVNGFALGGGSEIALACDFIYASEKAQFGLPEINLGIIPGYGGTQRPAAAGGEEHGQRDDFNRQDDSRRRSQGDRACQPGLCARGVDG